jgi:cellobiose PTS system EIIC component
MKEIEKKSVYENITDFTMKCAEPLGRFSNTAVVSSIVDGLIKSMPLIMVGSFFLILYVLGSPSVGTSGKALLPFLSPLANKFVWMNSVTLNLMALYCSVSISESYAEKKQVDVKSAGLLGLATFIIFTISGNDSAGGFPVTSFSANGLFVCMITSILSVRLYKFLVDKDIKIKMPASVPPAIGMAFTSLIPYALCFTLAWIVRDILNFDMVSWLTSVLQPVISGSDNVFVAGGSAFVVLLLWSIGLHGDNMFLSFFTPFGTMWLNENTTALAAGTSIYHLPHVLAGIGQTGLLRLTIWTACVWPLILLMILSKVKYLKTLGWAALPAGIFTIVEPVIYGLPIALNPFLIIPFLLSGTISTVVGYLLMATSFFGKFYALIPWATPPFILGPLGTGDIKTIIIPVISFFIGLFIYLPFWKQFEKDCLKKENVKQ